MDDPIYTKKINRQKPSYNKLVYWVSYYLIKLAEKVRQ